MLIICGFKCVRHCMQIVHLEGILIIAGCLSPCIGSYGDGGEQDFHTGAADVVNFESDEGVAHVASFRQSVTAMRTLDWRK